jgi:hypothetical protein
MRILNNLKGGPLVKLVKGEGCATRARARSPRRAEGEACRVEVETVTVVSSVQVHSLLLSSVPI